ncbi:MAG: aminotransferase class III-fold pyridoxal phosphate-dependent enzyme [Alphaproteobacteria bacterium]|nr:aminotransferase class III-fold pyridoxal phosphate-dependent enzyme [Alphaproteobacteria bacterium]
MLKNYDAERLRKLDVAHHLPAHSSYAEHQRSGGNRIITRAQGSTIYDIDGHKMLDGMAGLWCVNAGYGREELAKVAHDQMLELPFYNTLFKTVTPPAVELAAKLAEKLGGNLQHIFFNNSGSEANDTAYRLARYYWILKGEPQRTVFIARTNAYHGTTVLGAALGGMSYMHKQHGTPIADIEHIQQPYPFGEGFGEDEEAFATRAANALEERILQVGPERVAAFIGDPVLGAGGAIIPPAGYWPSIDAICKKYGILYISDEVICGFGRLGEWFGFQHYGTKPDIVCMAKGLSSGYIPVSATAVSSEIVETLRASDEEWTHGYTYSGHPVACAVALKNVEILEQERLVERTRTDTGPYLAKALERLRGHRHVGEARNLGLIGAVEIVAEKGTNRRCGTSQSSGVPVRDACIRRGLMVRAVRDSIVFSPPLIITHEEIDFMVDTIRAALDEATPELEQRS